MTTLHTSTSCKRPSVRMTTATGLRVVPACLLLEEIIIGGTEEYEIRHRDEDAAYRDNCPLVVGLYPSEGELVAAWNYSK